jgi:hypothetical protein
LGLHGFLLVEASLGALTAVQSEAATATTRAAKLRFIIANLEHSAETRWEKPPEVRPLCSSQPRSRELYHARMWRVSIID